MFNFIIILLLIIVVIGIFVPGKPLQGSKPPERHRSDPPRGLPWMDPNYQKRKKRERDRDSLL